MPESEMRTIPESESNNREIFIIPYFYTKAKLRTNLLPFNILERPEKIFTQLLIFSGPIYLKLFLDLIKTLAIYTCNAAYRHKGIPIN